VSQCQSNIKRPVLVLAIGHNFEVTPVSLQINWFILVTHVLLEAESEILTTLYIRFALSRISNENDVRKDRTRATRTSDNGDMVSGSIDSRTVALISFLLTSYNAIHCTHVTVYKMIKYTEIWSLRPDVACRLYCSGGSFRYVSVSQPVSRGDCNAKCVLTNLTTVHKVQYMKWHFISHIFHLIRFCSWFCQFCCTTVSIFFFALRFFQTVLYTFIVCNLLRHFHKTSYFSLNLTACHILRCKPQSPTLQWGDKLCLELSLFYSDSPGKSWINTLKCGANPSLRITLNHTDKHCCMFRTVGNRR